MVTQQTRRTDLAPSFSPAETVFLAGKAFLNVRPTIGEPISIGQIRAAPWKRAGYPITGLHAADALLARPNAKPISGERQPPSRLPPQARGASQFHAFDRVPATVSVQVSLDRSLKNRLRPEDLGNVLPSKYSGWRMRHMPAGRGPNTQVPTRNAEPCLRR